MKLINKKLNYTPNLLNYQKTYRAFSWNKAQKDQINHKNHLFNAASIAIDVNSQNQYKNKIALYWEGENGEKIKFTFWEMAKLSNRIGNVLKKLAVNKGDKVFIFLPRIPELYFSFLGIVKIGAVAGTLFSAFGPQALEDRLQNSNAKVLLTSLELYQRVAKIRNKLPFLKTVIIIDTENRNSFLQNKPLADKAKIKNCLWLYPLLLKAKSDLKCALMKPHDPAFILYTSGTTGKPKGVVHQHRAIIQQKISAYFVLDLKDDDIYWCTADPGWVTGISYEILGNWSLGTSTLVYAGRFDPGKWYSLIENYKVTVWYTAPTAIRMLMADSKLIKKYNLTSLRYLASVGEPLNPEAVFWSLKNIGIPFHDNYWQTETGGIVIANYPSLPIKPGSMGKPLPGITAQIANDNGEILTNNKEGNLVLKPDFPGLMIKIFKRPKKYASYFKKGWYYSGDRAYKDKDGYFWFIGRADDVIKTGGERVGPFEVESALVSHKAVIEAGVIGKPDALRGEIIKAFIVLKKDVKPSEELKENIKEFVKKFLAGHAYPREIEFIDKLPKTRSGKILRRLLKAKELGLALGDTSTLEEF